MHWGKTRLLYPMLLVLFLCIGSQFASAATSSTVLKSGSQGSSVFDLQVSLFQLGFLSAIPTGIFDIGTVEAVKKFQTSQGLAVDGAVGSQTWQRLKDMWSKATKTTHVVTSGDTLWSLAKKYGVTVQMLTSVNGLRDADSLQLNQKLIIPTPTSTGNATKLPTPVTKSTAQKAREAQARLTPELLSWSEVSRIFAVKMVARVVDVATGRSFRVKRLYGHSHADVEPLTAEDTAVLKALYGGKWSWDRRPVVVEVAGRRIAASINGYPHGGSTISNNNFSGHICVHFLGSKTHGSGRVDPDHQAAVKVAARSASGVVVAH